MSGLTICAALQLELPMPTADLQPRVHSPGTMLEACGGVIMRAGESLETPQVKKLGSGSTVQVLRCGAATGGRRLLVSDSSGQEGWVSAVGSNSQLLWRECRGHGRTALASSANGHGAAPEGEQAAAEAPETEPGPPAGPGYTAEELRTFRGQLRLDNWDRGGELSRYAFLNTAALFATAIIRRGGPILELEACGGAATAGCAVEVPGGRLPFHAYVAAAPIDGLVVLHRGRVAFESYPRMRPGDRHLWFSVSKVAVSTVLALLEDRGEVSVDRPIDHYLPELASSGWAGVSVLDILDMASGIDAPEEVEGAYTDPEVKNYQHEASLGWLPKADSMPESVLSESTHDFIATLGSACPAGLQQDYASVNTTVLAWLIERITGRAFADVFSDEVWGRMGAEADGLVTVNSRGIAAVHGGIISCLRDMARFGLLFTPSCAASGPHRLVSEATMRKIREGGRPSLLTDRERACFPGLRHATYQWDRVWEDGCFFKSGFGGQGLYVDPDRDLVAAWFGTHGSDAALPHPEDVCRDMLRRLF